MSEYRPRRTRMSSGFTGSMFMVLGIAGIPAVFLYFVIRTVMWAGAWSPPLIVAYLAIFLLPWSYYDTKEKRKASHFQMGDELFYTAFPKELNKALKKARRVGIPESRKRVLSELGQEQADGHHNANGIRDAVGKPSPRAVAYYLAAVSLLAVAAVLAVLGFRGIRKYGLTGLDGTDFTPLFLILSFLSVLAVAIVFFFRTSATPLRVSAGVCMFLLIWASVISVTNYKHYTSADLYLHLILMLVFLLVSLCVPAWAGDMLGEEKKEDRQREIQMGLFELGLISEIQLKQRIHAGSTIRG